MTRSTSPAESTTQPAAAVPAQAAPSAVDPGPAHGSRVRRLLTSPSLIAVVVWLVAAPVAFVAPTLQEYDPTRLRAWLTALSPLFLGVLAFAGLGVWRRTRQAFWLAPVAAGALAAWTIFALRIAVRGTPIPFGGLWGDSGRLVAAATRYQASPAIADAWIPGLSAEYPPLFPWLIGRTAALLDTPAWRLVADFEILFVSLTVLVAFLLWRTLTPTWVAFAVAAATFLPAAFPSKAYQTITLAVFIPWVLATLGRPPRGRWHWLASGALAGFIVLTYYGWVLWGAFGLVALAWHIWRTEADRRAYLWYLAKVAVVAAVVSAVYVVPYVWGALAQPGQTVGDLNPGPDMHQGLFPFLEGPFPALAVLQCIGFVGLVWLARTQWWAKGLLALTLSAYVFRFVFSAYFVVTEHSALAGYASRLSHATLVIAGVLVLVHAVPLLVERLHVAPPREVLVLALAVLVAWTGFILTKDWLPGTNGRYSDYTQLALAEPRTDAAELYNAVSVPPSAWFPADAIRAVGERAYGPDVAHHLSLSADERLYAYLPWAGYAVNERGAAPGRARMIDRYDEIHTLAQTRDPDQFSHASATTPFGAIDIFVLRRTEAGWVWEGNTGFDAPIVTEVFQPSQFQASDWDVTILYGSDYVMITRRS